MQAVKKPKTVRRRITVISILSVIAVLSIFICVGIGTVRIPPAEILKALFTKDDTAARLLICSLRLPRILTGGLVGICLSLSGCILQGVMKNKLASPSTIGVTAGASLVGYLTLVMFPAYWYLLPIGSIIGAFLITLLIYLLAYRNGAAPSSLILSGMAVSALCGAFSDIIKTVFADSLGNASGFLVGGLNGVGRDSFRMLLPFAASGILLCLFLPSKMNILLLGDETAASMGIRTERFRLLLITAASLLSGAAISAAGLISFVGLIVPHIARLLVGSDYRYLLPASALLGFSLVTVCDTVGRVIMPPGEIPVSIILSLIGAPFFLWLLRSRGKEGI